jgi:hypothetical protein
LYGPILLTIHGGNARQGRSGNRNESPRISLREFGACYLAEQPAFLFSFARPAVHKRCEQFACLGPRGAEASDDSGVFALNHHLP